METSPTGAPAATAPASPEPPRRVPLRWRRGLMWGALVLLLLVAQTLLVALTFRYEADRAQDEIETVANESAASVRRDLLSLLQSLQALAWVESGQPIWNDEVAALLRSRRDLKRVEWRDAAMNIADVADTPYAPRLFTQMPRKQLGVDAEVACAAARRAAAPMFSRSYYVPLPGGLGVEVIDLCLPRQRGERTEGFIVASLALQQVLEVTVSARDASRYEFSFVEGDGTRLARAGAPRGLGVYQAQHLVDLPGVTLQLRADSASGQPSLIPNVSTALVLGLSIALLALVLLLARDVRRRARAERALAEALVFRSAMEDSLPTGLRARDLAGRISYVNPAFCAMVGFSADELRASSRPPYWPPEFAEAYVLRQAQRLAGNGRSQGESREGYETVFMRKNGERFPAMIYEAPLVDSKGRHTGWMSAALDLSAQRRVEELSRQQQERLQATARLATVGEMASLLSHELNQPLAAIASYASGSINLLTDPDPEPTTPAMLRQGLERIAEQAERAGRVIKSVHDFVRRREQLHETVVVSRLIDAVMPLARLQARKGGVRIQVDLPPPGSSAGPLRVRCDRTMVEQVLLNLARNGIQAMEGVTPAAERVLTLGARQHHPGWVTLTVSDAGTGIAPDVAAKLFTPFFTTKPEGMGLGLSLCRTVIEQHGGALEFGLAASGHGTEFRFTLPAAPSVERRGVAAAPDTLSTRS